MKCKICKTNEALWAMQYIGEDIPTFYTLGWHIRGFAVTKVCDQCKDSETQKAVNKLIEPMNRFLGGQIIPLDDYHANDWIQYNLMTPEFVRYFRTHPHGETDLYHWNTRKMDELWNLRIYAKN